MSAADDSTPGGGNRSGRIRRKAGLAPSGLRAVRRRHRLRGRSRRAGRRRHHGGAHARQRTRRKHGRAADRHRALQDSVTAIGSELALLKTGVVTAQKNANSQLGKIAERLDRTEKAQVEPAGKLAKIQESIERLEHRQGRRRSGAGACVRYHRIGDALKEDVGSRRAAEAGGCAISTMAAAVVEEPQRHSVSG